MSFSEWVSRIAPEIEEVRGLLDQPLSDEPEPLWQAARDVEARYGRLQYLLAKADAYLDVAAAERMPKGKTLTAAEKEAQVDALCAPEREVRDTLKGLLEAVKQRVMLAQSRMAYCRDVYIAPVKKGGA